MGRLGCGIIILSLVICFFAADAAAQAVEGAGFSSAPVMLDQSKPVAPGPVTPMDLLTLRDPEGLSISPDGRHVAFVVGQAVYQINGYRSGLFVASTDGDPRILALGSAGMPHWDDINQWIPESPQWSPDSQWISYRTRMSREEHWQVAMWCLKDGGRKQVTSVDGDVNDYRWVAEGKALFLTVLKPRATHDRTTAEEEQGILFNRALRPYEITPVLMQMEEVQAPEREYWIYNIGADRERPATEKEVHAWGPGTPSDVQHRFTILANYHIIDARSSPDSSKVAYLYAVDDVAKSPTWARRLLVSSDHGGHVVEVTPQAHVVDQYWWTSDGRTLYFTELTGRGRSPELWAAHAGDWKPELVFKEPGSEYISSFSSDEHGHLFACLRENNTTPPQVAVIDGATKRIRTLVDLNPGYASLLRSPAERLEGTNPYGEGWWAYLVKPLDYVPGKRYPLIVTTYRSGDYFLRGASGDQNPIQVYAAHGFAVLCFDVGPARNTVPGSFSSQLLDWASPTASIEEAVRRLAREGVIDFAKVGIAGFSHGEEIVGYAVSHTPLFRAAVGAANYDPCFYFLGGDAWDEQFGRWGLGGWPEGESKKNWQEIAMSMNADKISTPILENASDTDYPIYLPAYRSLTDLGKPIELYIYPNELHVRNQPKHRLEIYERNLDWFRFWLKGEEDPDPAKAEQYRRWRHLRDGRAAVQVRPAVKSKEVGTTAN